MKNWVPLLPNQSDGRTALIMIAVICLGVSMHVAAAPTVGAIIDSEFANANANGSCTFNWEETTKKGHKKLCSSNGYKYYSSTSTKSARRYYVCKNNKRPPCKCSSRKPTDRPCQCRKQRCSGTLVLHLLNGKVVNNVKHTCIPDEKIIRKIDECRSRQSEESGCSSSILMPCSALPTLTMLPQQPLPDATRETANSHTQHDNPSDFDMHQGGLPLAQQSSFPGWSGASHTELGGQLLDYNYPQQFCAGKVVNNMKHISKPDENVIHTGWKIDECRSRQLEGSRHSSSILMPCPASPTLTVEQLLQPSSDSTRETANSHTQHDNPPDLDMQQGGLPLEQQSSFPGGSGAFHTELGGHVLDYDLLQSVGPTGEMDFQELDVGTGIGLCALNDAGCDFGRIEFEDLKPEFITHPRDVQVMPESVVVFSAKTRIGDNATYAWKHNGQYKVGEVWEDLIIFRASVKDEGKYKCVAFNEYGTVYSEPAYLKLISKKKERITVPQSIDLNQSFQRHPFLVDDRNFDQSDQDYFAAYNIVSTEAKDTGTTSQLVTGIIQ